MVGGCAIFQGCSPLCQLYGAYEIHGFSLSFFGVEIGKWNCFVDICRLIVECITYTREQVTGRAWDLGEGVQRILRVPSYDSCIRACIKLGISGGVNVGLLEAIPSGAEKTWGIALFQCLCQINLAGKLCLICIYVRYRYSDRIYLPAKSFAVQGRRFPPSRAIRSGVRWKGVFFLLNCVCAQCTPFLGTGVLQAINASQTGVQPEAVPTYQSSHCYGTDCPSRPCGDHDCDLPFELRHECPPLLLSRSWFTSTGIGSIGAALADPGNRANWHVPNFGPHFEVLVGTRPISPASGDIFESDEGGSLMQMPPVSDELAEYILQAYGVGRLRVFSWVHFWNQRNQWAFLQRDLSISVTRSVRDQLTSAWRDYQVSANVLIVPVRPALLGSPAFLLVPVLPENYIVVLGRVLTPDRQWTGTFLFGPFRDWHVSDLFMLALPTNLCVWQNDCTLTVGTTSYDWWSRLMIYEGAYVTFEEVERPGVDCSSTEGGSDWTNSSSEGDSTWPEGDVNSDDLTLLQTGDNTATQHSDDDDAVFMQTPWQQQFDVEDAEGIDFLNAGGTDQIREGPMYGDMLQIGMDQTRYGDSLQVFLRHRLAIGSRPFFTAYLWYVEEMVAAFADVCVLHQDRSYTVSFLSTMSSHVEDQPFWVSLTIPQPPPLTLRVFPLIWLF